MHQTQISTFREKANNVTDPSQNITSSESCNTSDQLFSDKLNHQPFARQGSTSKQPNKESKPMLIAAALKSCTKKMNYLDDIFSQYLNRRVIQEIESYIRTFEDLEKEVFKYLAYYWKKWGGNIEIPIKNLCDRFNCSARWIHKLLRRIYDAGWIITTGGGYGRKVTKRTFTERGKIVYQAMVKGFGALKQLIPKSCADYCADYSGGHSNYISSKEDILQSKSNINVSNTQEKEQKPLLQHASDCIKRMRESIDEKRT